MDKDSYEAIVFNHDFQKETLTLALKIVKKFLIDNKRKLVGGMEMDFALRSKGSKLYPDDKLPDYDFLTPEFHRDAYHIGELLVLAGIQNVSVIRAYHVSTMRVRVNFISVADASYMPNELYEKIPTMLYNDILMVHPHWQMLDQYRALSLPFENPPMESMINRWKKDLTRNSMLMEYFPIDRVIDDISPVVTSIDDKLLNNCCLHGVAALAYWAEQAKELGFKTLLSFSNEGVTLNNCPLEIFTNELSIINRFNEPYEYYNSTMDKIPRYVKCNGVLVYDNLNRMMSSTVVGKYYIANLMAILCHLGTKAILYDDKACKNNYVIALNLLEFACDKYINIKDTDTKKINIDLINNLLPVVSTYGISNVSDSYELQIFDADNRMNHSKISNTVPKNAYPTNVKKIPIEYYDFHPEHSSWYMFDGKICVKPFKII